ncbi:hypothetical protein H6P81_019153 [Aristolochia fimbriata]|uniref:Uncharacterized protein n=1 Tax=Aristolochia fimbriata TaxID=158543 RepID=A0AAV7DRT7_ARIFI|nr:hypothetical protein H6P81_019153 [Aristolochia fimbriata]
MVDEAQLLGRLRRVRNRVRRRGGGDAAPPAAVVELLPEKVREEAQEAQQDALLRHQVDHLPLSLRSPELFPEFR